MQRFTFFNTSLLLHVKIKILIDNVFYNKFVTSQKKIYIW